jgi:hypothetical protein
MKQVLMSAHCCQVKRMLYCMLSFFYPSMYQSTQEFWCLYQMSYSVALLVMPRWQTGHRDTVKERTNASCDNRACRLVSTLMWLLEQIPPLAAIPRMNTKTPRCEGKCGHASKRFIIGMQLQIKSNRVNDKVPLWTVWCSQLLIFLIIDNPL